MHNEAPQISQELHTPIIVNFSKIEQFLQQLPNEIQGSAKTYSKSEIERAIADVLFGNRSLAILTNAYGIHDMVHGYMRERVAAAWKVFPEYRQANFHPQTGKQFTTFEETFRFADYLLRTSELKPQNQKLSQSGLNNSTPQECAGLYDDMFTRAHGYSRSSGQQSHLYFENNFTIANAQANKGLSPNKQLDHINALSGDFVAAQLSRDGGRVAAVVAETDAFLANGGINDLAREYKFHVTPPPQLLPIYIDRLLQAIQHDPYLRNNVMGFKVNTLPNEKNNDQLIPDIVLYPRTGQAAQTARASAAIFLERLKVHLADLDTHAQFIGTPRFNSQVTNTIAVAESGGDVKNQLQQMRLLDKYFSAKSNHAFVASEHLEYHA